MASLRRLANSVLVLAFLRRIASSGRYFFNASGDKFYAVSGIEIPIFSNYRLQKRLHRDYNARYLRLLGDVISGKSYLALYTLIYWCNFERSIKGCFYQTRKLEQLLHTGKRHNQ
jgi:hypothetical protein